MALTPQTEIDSVLAMLAVDMGLRHLFDQIVNKLELSGQTPDAPAPSDRDWLAMELDAGEGHRRPLADLLFRARDAIRSCPQWVERIKARD